MATERDVNQARKVANSSEFTGVKKKPRKLGSNPTISYNDAARGKPNVFSDGTGIGQRTQGGAGGANGVAASDASGVGAQGPRGPNEGDTGFVDFTKRLGGAAVDVARSANTAIQKGLVGGVKAVQGAARTVAEDRLAGTDLAGVHPSQNVPAATPSLGGQVPPTVQGENDSQEVRLATGPEGGAGNTAVATEGTQTNRRIGDFAVKEGEGRNVLYEDDAGNFLSGERPAPRGGDGGGGVSVLGGPGGIAGSDDPVENQKAIDANVAAYDRQTAALRANRELRQEIQDGARNPRVGGGTSQPAVSQYEQELNARNARVGSNRYTGDAPRRIAAQAAADNAATNARKAALGDATTRRGQDIAASTAQDRIDADIFSDQIGADVSANETQRKIGESARDFQQRERNLALDDRKARVMESEGFNKLSVAQQKNLSGAINDATKHAADTGDRATAFRQLVVSGGYKTAASIFPDQEEAYLASIQKPQE